MFRADSFLIKILCAFIFIRYFKLIQGRFMKYFYIFILLFVFSCAQEAEKKPGVTHPQWSKHKVIYELNIRQFSGDGSFKAVEQRLVSIKDLGVGIIWLMPVHPIGEKNRKGKLGSYYAVKDYYKVNPEFGSMADFKSLVNRIHELGMYVILDWVANHTAWDNPLTQSNPDFYTKDSLGRFISPVPGWHDVIDLNYTNRELWTYMINAMKFWVREAGVDGFRCDVAEMVPVEFWNRARQELNKIKPVFMLAEGEKPYLHEKSFDMTYSWNLMHTMNQIASGKKNARSIDTLLWQEEKAYPAGALRMRFTTNHDENSWNGTVFERLDGGVKTFAVLCATLPGVPMIYSGQEVGMNKRLNFFDKDPIEWRINNFRRFYRRLLGLYPVHPALHKGDMDKIDTDNDDYIYAFQRSYKSKEIVVILNLSGKEQSVRIESAAIKGKMLNFFTGHRVDYEGEHVFNMQPWEYHLYLKD